MSVIAKLNIRAATVFGTGNLIELGCVCENDLMTAYATSEEDKLFSQYSPWGEMKVSQPSGFSLGQAPDHVAPTKAYYVMMLANAEVENTKFPGAAAYCRARLQLTDFGDGRDQIVEFHNDGAQDGLGIDRLIWKMSVNNPGALRQFKPGSGYWLAFYPADQFTRDTAIAAAHAQVPETKEKTLTETD